MSAQIKIGQKSYGRISDVVKDYLETKKQLEELKAEFKNRLKESNQHLKKLIKFFKDNGLTIPQESEPKQDKTEPKTESKTESKPVSTGT